MEIKLHRVTRWSIATDARHITYRIHQDAGGGLPSYMQCHLKRNMVFHKLELANWNPNNLGPLPVVLHGYVFPWHLGKDHNRPIRMPVRRVRCAFVVHSVWSKIFRNFVVVLKCHFKVYNSNKNLPLNKPQN